MHTYHLTNPPAGTNDPAAKAEIRPLQNALQNNKFYGGKIDGIFSAASGDACKRAKYHLGYPASACQRTGGQQLFDFLTGAEHLPQTYTLRRRARGFGFTREEVLRGKIVAWAQKGVADEPQIHYAQLRPMPSTWRLPMFTDCSGFVTLCYHLAGAKDPNGLGYNGEGWTGTLLDHGETIPLSQATIGDLVIWGSHPGHHVAVFVEMDKIDRANSILVSHGSERGPKHVSLAHETAAQHRSYVVKRYI